MSYRHPFEITGRKAKMVWHPVIEFGHLLDFKRTDLYGGPWQISFWHLGNSLDHPRFKNMLAYGEKFQLTFSCNFSFADFPFDTHECPMIFGDPKYSTRRIMFNSTTLYYIRDSYRNE